MKRRPQSRRGPRSRAPGFARERRRGFGRDVASVCVALVCAMACVPVARATFPGADGRLAFDLTYGFYCGEGDDYPCAIGRYEGINWVAPPFGRRTLLARWAFSPAFSSDGTRLAYLTNGELGALLGVWVARADGSRPRRVLKRAWSPAFSPDGHKLVVVRGDAGNLRTTKIATVDLDTGHVRELATGEDPAYGIDGRIAYAAPELREVDQRIAVLDPATGRKRVITSGPFDLQPDWSPDAREIVFARDAQNLSTASIWTVRDDGRGAKRLTAGWHPVFSPSGRWIVFCRSDGLYRMRADGADLRRLLATRPLMPDRDTWVDALAPAWQPLPR